MSHVSIHRKARLLAPALLAVALAACSGTDESAPADTAAPAAKPAAKPAEPAVAAKVQSMGTEDLRDAASAALRENRMYAPAGDNAMEYYLALRDKLPDDASVKSALTDLQPYTLIAAEQSLNREDFTEAERLVALIEKVDATAPALPRLKQGITNAMQVAAKRTVDEADRARRTPKTAPSSRSNNSVWPSSKPPKPPPRSSWPNARKPHAARASAWKPNARPPPSARPTPAPPPRNRLPRPRRSRQRHRPCAR